MAHRYVSTEETRTILNKLIYEVAKGLGEGWYPRTGQVDYISEISGPNNASVWLRLEGDTKGDRIEVSGGFYVGKERKHEKPRSGYPANISVALSRGTDVLVKEIKRRFLPEYLPKLAEAQAQVAAENEYVRKVRENTLRVSGNERGYLEIEDGHGTVEASADTVSLKLYNLTVEQAVTVVNLLKRK